MEGPEISTLNSVDQPKTVESVYTFTVYYDIGDPAECAIAGCCMAARDDIICIPLAHDFDNASALDVVIPSPILIMLTTRLTVDEMAALVAKGFRETRVFVPTKSQSDISDFKYSSLLNDKSFYAISYDDFFDYFPIQGMSSIKIAWNLLLWSGKMNPDSDPRITAHYNKDIGADLKLGMLIKYKSYFKAAYETVKNTLGIDNVEELISYGRAIKDYEDTNLAMSLKQPINFNVMFGKVECTVKAIYCANFKATLGALERAGSKLKAGELIMMYQYQTSGTTTSNNISINGDDADTNAKITPGYAFAFYTTDNTIDTPKLVALLTNDEVCLESGWLPLGKFHKRFPAI
jgi:hypothetical protein